MNLERKITDKDTRSEAHKDKKVKVSKKLDRKDKEDIFYCADFNRGKCSFETSHQGKWAGKDVMKLHICKKCLAEDGQKKAHSEQDELCHNKE